LTASEENDVIDNDNNHMIHNGPWRLALSGPSYIAAISHILGRSMREQLYKSACVRRSFEQSAANDKNNIPLIYEIFKTKV
jgi:Zn-dependent oligopeptidase